MHVLELADVARPVVPLQQLQRLARDAGHRLVHLLGVLREEVLGEQRDVLAPLAQRRQHDRDDVEAVVQVLAEPALGDGLGQVLVGGGDDPDVGLQFLEAADAAEAPLLQHAQQLHLHHRAHLADLVEEDGALLGDLEQPLLVAVGAGEGAAHVAEQLRLEQRSPASRRS